MSHRRVVVTGIGLVSSLGIGTEANWAALNAGQSGIGTITKFDAAAFATQIAGEVKGFDPLQFIDKKDVKKMDVFIQYAIAAADFAMTDAHLTITPEQAPRTGVFIASGIGGFTTIEREHKALLEGGPRKISPFFIPSAIINLAAGQVSIRFGAKGPNSATCTACSASAHAIGDAYEIIRRGDADVMIAGGSEAAITPMGIGGFGAMRALSTRNDEPARASRPFDVDRDGFIVGEGAGVLILDVKAFPETTKLAKALTDGAKISCKSPAPAKLADWCCSWAKAGHQKKLGRDAAMMLLELVGTSMGQLDQELEKLAVAIGPKAEIAGEDVLKLVGRSRAANVFHILDAVGDGKPQVAMTILHQLFAEGEDPLAILGALTSNLRKLATVGRHAAMGQSLGPAMDAAGVASWPQARQSAERQIKHLGMRRLQELPAWLIEINLGLKGGSPLPPRMQLERLLVKLARPRIS